MGQGWAGLSPRVWGVSYPGCADTFEEEGGKIVQEAEIPVTSWPNFRLQQYCGGPRLRAEHLLNCQRFRRALKRFIFLLRFGQREQINSSFGNHQPIVAWFRALLTLWKGLSLT